jgi:uncharacterized Zn finger protein (UPF0148 family)
VAIEEEKVKKITAMLEQGGTMLARHHECGAPLFKYRGRVVCPVCDEPTGDTGVAGGAAGGTVVKVNNTAQQVAQIDDSELREALLGYARTAAKRLTGGNDPDGDALLLSSIESALRCATFLRR